MERNFKGIWIPKEIWLSKELTLQEKVMLVEIDSLDDEVNGCFASNKYFAEFFEVSNSRIAQIIGSLVTKKFIRVDYQFEGKEITQRTIKINRPPYPEKLNTYLEKLNTPFRKPKGEYLEKLKDNNTSINNKELINNKKFIKPSLEELQNFIKENNLNVNGQDFIDYYESNGWKVGRNAMKDWKATCRRWSRTNKDKPVNTDRPSWLDNDFKREVNYEEVIDCGINLED